jgi:hypothetical protein
MYIALSSAVGSMLLLLLGLLPLDRRNMTGTPAGVSGQLRRLSDMEGVEGEGTSPRLMAHTPPPEPWSRLIVVRGSRANVPDHETPNRPGRTHSYLRRGLPLRAAERSLQSPRHRARGEVCLGVRRRPAEDGGVGAPPPAGRAERRQHLDLILIRHIRGMRSCWQRAARPAQPSSGSDRGCPLSTVVVPPIWHANGTAGR